MAGCCPGDFGDDNDPQSSSAPGLLDSITGWFSSSPSSQPTADSGQPTAAPSFQPDPNQMVSKYFTLAQLCVTSLPYPNLPADQATLDNLVKLGVLLDAIQDNVGRYTIASAHRSVQNQMALMHGAGGAAAASMAVPKSYHIDGIAADITPIGMSTHEFAQKMYNDPLVNSLCGQLCDKGDGGNETSLHISTQTSKFPSCTPMKVNSAGQYVRLTPSEIGVWAASTVDTFSSDVATSDDQEEEDDGMDSGIPWLWISVGVAAALGGVYWSWRKKHSR